MHSPGGQDSQGSVDTDGGCSDWSCDAAQQAGWESSAQQGPQQDDELPLFGIVRPAPAVSVTGANSRAAASGAIRQTRRTVVINLTIGRFRAASQEGSHAEWAHQHVAHLSSGRSGRVAGAWDEPACL